MICKECAEAADVIAAPGLVGMLGVDPANLHDACEGCDCQHDWQAQLAGTSLHIT